MSDEELPKSEYLEDNFQKNNRKQSSKNLSLVDNFPEFHTTTGNLNTKSKTYKKKIKLSLSLSQKFSIDTDKFTDLSNRLIDQTFGSLSSIRKKINYSPISTPSRSPDLRGKMKKFLRTF